MLRRAEQLEQLEQISAETIGVGRKRAGGHYNSLCYRPATTDVGGTIDIVT